MIKLVVLDVDGTSLDRDNQFYDDDIKEIDFYKKKGIEFMFKMDPVKRTQEKKYFGA